MTLLLQRLLAERSQEALCHQKPCRRFAVTLRKEKKILNPFIALSGTSVNHSGNERRRCWCGTNLFLSELFPQWCCMWGYFRQKDNVQKHFTVAFALLLSCISKTSTFNSSQCVEVKTPLSERKSLLKLLELCQSWVCVRALISKLFYW